MVPNQFKKNIGFQQMKNKDISERVFKIKDKLIQDYCWNIVESYPWRFATPDVFRQIFNRINRYDKIKKLNTIWDQ